MFDLFFSLYDVAQQKEEQEERRRTKQAKQPTGPAISIGTSGPCPRPGCNGTLRSYKTKPPGCRSCGLTLE